jgi:hypothetical protein
MNRNNPGSAFCRERESATAQERRATEEEIQEGNQLGRLREEARQLNEDYDEQAVRNVRRRTTSEGQVLAHARQSNLFG